MPWRSSIVAWRVLLKFACKLLHTLNHANQVLIFCLQNYTIKAWCLICAGLQDSNVLFFSFSRNAFLSLHLHPCRMHFWQHQKVQDRGIWQTSWGKQWQQKAQPGSAGDGATCWHKIIPFRYLDEPLDDRWCSDTGKLEEEDNVQLAHGKHHSSILMDNGSPNEIYTKSILTGTFHQLMQVGSKQCANLPSFVQV